MPRRAAVLGSTLLLVLLTTWSAAVGPHDVLRGDGPDAGQERPADRPQVMPGDEDDTPRQREPRHTTSVLAQVLVAVAELAGAAFLLWLLARAARSVRRGWRRRTPRDVGDAEGDDEVTFEVLDPLRAVEAVVADATAQRGLLLEGSPRNGIVACWHRFEVQASSIGLAREPWETSSEFTLRLLDVVGADSRPVSELAALYREARHSDHELGEGSRDRALAALDVIHADLRRRAGLALGTPR